MHLNSAQLSGTVQLQTDYLHWYGPTIATPFLHHFLLQQSNQLQQAAEGLL